MHKRPKLDWTEVLPDLGSVEVVTVERFLELGNIANQVVYLNHLLS